jgi:hypothetical protein
MKWYISLLVKISCVFVAIVIAVYLYISNLPPFSLIAGQEETTTGIIPASAEPPITGGEAVIVFVPASLDLTIAADESGLRMQEGANTWTKTITLINPSPEPVGVYFFAQGVNNCSETDPKDCVQFPSQVTVAANESTSIEVAFSEISPQDSVPLAGKLILAGAGLLREIPFSIRGAWQKEPTDYLDITSRSIADGFTLFLLTMVISLLYSILFTKVSPFFLPEKYLPIQADIGDDNRPLWATFHSRLRELKEQSLGGNFVNPQPTADTIDLPTNLGREGDVLRAIIELLNWILPRRGKSIRLQVMESRTNGKGLSASIVSNSNDEVLAERVFWSSQYNLEATTTDIEDLLMTPVILWLSDWKSKLNGKNPASDQGWEIEAYCRLAGRLWSTDRELGRKLYLDVLRRDPGNKRAHLGLGRIFIEDSHRKDMSVYERDKLLKLASAYLEEVSADPSQPDAVWIAAEYNLAVSRLYLEELGKAKTDCDQLFSKLDAIPKLSNEEKIGVSKIWMDLKAINLDFKQILTLKPHHPQNQRESDELKALLDIYNDDPEFWTSFTTMSLILKHIVMLKDEPPQNEDDLEGEINNAIAELAQHINSKFDPDRLLLINLHYRSQYNVACYFSRCYLTAKTNKWANKNQYAELALDYLRLALAHGGGLMKLAREDPALEPIRRDRRKKFEYIVGGTAADEEVEEDQNVTRIVVQGPIVLKSEETALPSQGLEPKNKKISTKARRLASRT